MIHPVCGQTYTSRKTSDELVCTFRQGHDTDDPEIVHSWEWLRREENEALTVTGGPPEIGDLIEGIAAGLYDPYIESLLAALHGRKRAMRSVPHPYGRTEE